MRPSRPLLRYHGGKWKLAPWIIAQFPPHSVYVEPFGGGASVLLRKPRAKCEIYNDLDGEVVNLFRVLRERTDDLLWAIETTPYARAEFDRSFEICEDPLEKARLTLVRSFMAYGTGLTRVRKDGVPMRAGFRGTRRGKRCTSKDWASLPENVAEIALRLQGVVIECRDALEVLRIYDSPETLHYVDPPYLGETRSDVRRGKAGYRYEMSDEAHARLADVLNSLQGAVVLSGYPSPLYDALYAGWERIETSAWTVNARPTTECLWMRNVDRGLFRHQPEACGATAAPKQAMEA